MGGRVVLVHPVIALLGLVERDAENIVAAQNLGAVIKPCRQGELRHDKHWSLLAQLREEWQRLAEDPASNERPALRLGRCIETLQIACHGQLPTRLAAWNRDYS